LEPIGQRVGYSRHGVDRLAKEADRTDLTEIGGIATRVRIVGADIHFEGEVTGVGGDGPAFEVSEFEISVLHQGRVAALWQSSERGKAETKKPTSQFPHKILLNSA
jgi:hypothetical protein